MFDNVALYHRASRIRRAIEVNTQREKLIYERGCRMMAHVRLHAHPISSLHHFKLLDPLLGC